MNGNHEAWFKIFREKAKSLAKHIVLPEGVDDRSLIAAPRLMQEGICRLTVLGDPGKILARARELYISLEGVTLRDPGQRSRHRRPRQRLLRIPQAQGHDPGEGPGDPHRARSTSAA